MTHGEPFGVFKKEWEKLKLRFEDLGDQLPLIWALAFVLIKLYEGEGFFFSQGQRSYQPNLFKALIVHRDQLFSPRANDEAWLVV